MIVATLYFVLSPTAFAHEGIGGDEYAAADIMLLVAMLFVLMTGIGVLMSWNNGEFKNPEQLKLMMLDLALDDEQGEDIQKYALTEA